MWHDSHSITGGNLQIGNDSIMTLGALRDEKQWRDGEMSEFTAVLRHNIEGNQRSLKAAQQADHPYEVHLHSARLLDLLDRAAENGVDTTGWIHRDTLASAAANCA
jgi:hypothetical protein